MNTALAIEVILSATNLGLCLLTSSLLIIRKDSQRIYLPLIFLFISFSFSSVSTILEIFTFSGSIPYIQLVSRVLAYVSLLVLFPALWLYVRNITREYPTSWKIRDLWHFVPFVIGIGVGILLLSLPNSMLNQIVGEGSGPTTQLLIVAAISLYALMIIWVCQSACYLFVIVRQLIRHHALLKTYFSSTENQELIWIYCVAFLLFSALVSSVLGLFFNILDHANYFIDGVDLVLVFILAHWGLRQSSFVEKTQTNMELEYPLHSNISNEPQKITTKYEKSALSESHIDRIEANIHAVIVHDKLYLNPNLTLGHLAKAVGEQSNYVSQTLNGRIGETFFDFINAWRIKEAIPLINETNDTILDIAYAVGFNSRSSFYKAFKREIGVTPSAYRNSGS